jgi:predicted translin family RNA/ssDNA-binding protein
MAWWHELVWSGRRTRQALHDRTGWEDLERYCHHLPTSAELTPTVPVNLKDQDAFHVTIEEYLQALITLIEELARLAINSVTLGDYQRPLQISQFVKDVHAGFQILNLKNDSLRRRSDGIKYSVKKVEDIVYDLSLRNLVPKTEPTAQ